MQVLKFYPTSNPYKKRIYSSLKEFWSNDISYEDDCSDSTKEQSTKYISRIVHSTHHTSSSRYKGKYDKKNYKPTLTKVLPDSYYKSHWEERMSRRKRIIRRMWYERCCTRQFHRTRPPLRHTKIDDTIEDKYSDNPYEYPKSHLFIFIIMVFDTCKPKYDEKNPTSNDDRFTKYMYDGCVFRTHKRLCREKEGGIEREKIL